MACIQNFRRTRSPPQSAPITITLKPAMPHAPVGLWGVMQIVNSPFFLSVSICSRFSSFPTFKLFALPPDLNRLLHSNPRQPVGPSPPRPDASPANLHASSAQRQPERRGNLRHLPGRGREVPNLSSRSPESFRAVMSAYGKVPCCWCW